MKLFGVRKTAVAEPKLLVEPFGVDHERIAFPIADGTPIVEGIVGITTKLTLLSTSICVDDPVIAVAAADQHENPFSIPVFIELKSIGQLILTRTARRHAI